MRTPPDPNRACCYLCGEHDQMGPRCHWDIKYCRKCLAAGNQPPCKCLLEQWKTSRRRAGESDIPYRRTG